MNYAEEKEKIKEQYRLTDSQMKQSQGVVNSCQVRLNQLQGKFELLTEMEQKEESEKSIPESPVEEAVREALKVDQEDEKITENTETIVEK
jgi:hypothetical protein